MGLHTLPISVERCEQRAWHLHLWPVGEEHGTNTDCLRVPFVCHSWRHAGDCRQWRGALDWWRVVEALKKHSCWVYVVLTFRQPRSTAGRWQSYIQAGACWSRLRCRLTRRYGHLAYVQTLERHKKGGCHVNVVMANQQITQAVSNDWRSWRRDVLIPQACESGFGPVAWVELCDQHSEALAGYITKLANELTGQASKSQIPIDAPRHFRRIRASRGLLPKKPPSDFTGELVKCPVPEYNCDIAESRDPCRCHGHPD